MRETTAFYNGRNRGLAGLTNVNKSQLLRKMYNCGAVKSNYASNN